VSSTAHNRSRLTELSVADVVSICDTGRTEPFESVASAVDLLAQRLLGHRLFTLMRLRRETMELETTTTSFSFPGSVDALRRDQLRVGA
jgi:hypothetical protein